MADSPRKTIGDALGAAVRAIKSRDVAAFLAARPNPNEKLSDAELTALIVLVWKSVGKAFTPTSPQGSISIGTILDADGFPQLSLEALLAVWEHVSFDPLVTGLDRKVFTFVWQDIGNPAAPAALWLKYGTGTKNWSKVWPVSGGGGVSLSDRDPSPIGELASPGTGFEASRYDHVHALGRPAKIRYYLTNVARANGSGDFLLSSENPFDEEHAIDLSHSSGSSSWLQFVSPEGSPGIGLWQGGEVVVHLRIKLNNPQAGHTYRLYTGDGSIVYTAMLWDWTHDNTYQVKESAPGEPVVSEIYNDVDLLVPVAAIAAGTDGRLGFNVRLRTFVGSSEATFLDEHVFVRVGGDHASYIDTLFTPSGSFSGLHNDWDGRSARNAHPQEAITPGRILTPENGTVTPTNGVFSVPVNSNFVEIDGTDEIIGISTEGWAGTNSLISVFFQTQRVMRRLQSVPSGYAAVTWGTGEAGYLGDIATLTIYANCEIGFRLVGGFWRVAYTMNL